MNANNKLYLLSACLLTLLSNCAFAQEIDFNSDHRNKGFYAGFGVGASHLKLNKEDLTTQYNNNGITTTSITQDDSSTAYKAFIGYKFNKNLSLEGGYFDLGRLDYKSLTVPSGEMNGSVRYRGGNLDLIGTIPLAHNFAFLGIIGTHKGSLKNRVSANTNIPMPEYNDFSMKYGVGFQYKLSEAVYVRAQAEKYKFKNNLLTQRNSNMYSVNLILPFNSSKW